MAASEMTRRVRSFFRSRSPLMRDRLTAGIDRGRFLARYDNPRSPGTRPGPELRKRPHRLRP
nr:hypothetical protein KitaXyl93_16970 [Kitasatospora sp. Xyl93]